jgi:hypothetical protein
MTNQRLTDLNFCTLLKYGGMPHVKNRYDKPAPCQGYCVACDKAGFVTATETALDQMSHGADTSDFEQMLGNLPLPGCVVSVVFLLESPGGYYDNGQPVPFEGVNKQPPVCGYYWMPSGPTQRWPETSEGLHDHYGSYFAYLLYRHRLKSAYFTNIVKCSLGFPKKKTFVPYYVVKDESNPHSRIRRRCCDLFLSNELRILSPAIVFYFGQRAARMGKYLQLQDSCPGAVFCRLCHPAARNIRWTQLVESNDATIREALTSNGHFA